MAVNVKEIMTRCKVILQDGDSMRWPVSELAIWIADGAKEIALQQPSATSKHIVLQMTSGTLQKVDEDLYQSVIRVIRNVSGADPSYVGGRSITPTTREVLDTQNADWHNPSVVPARPLVRNVVIDVMDPQTFFVYPPNDGTGKVECLLSAIPTFSAEVTGDVDDIASYADITLPLLPVFQSSLVDYTLYRAFSKDAQVEGAAQRASAHWGLFTGALAARMQSQLTANVNLTNAQPRG